MTDLQDSTIPPRRARTAHEYVKAVLRESIVGGSLEPGHRLVQSDLAAKLGVSTTPIREALRDLTIEGLVQTDPHKGAIVRALDIREVEEIYELRMLLEPVMIRRTGAVISDADLTEAESLHRTMVETTDQSAWVELNRKFHAALSPGDDDSRLAGFLRSLRTSSTPWVRLSLSSERIEESYAEHAQLIELYRDRDVEAIVEATVEHLQRTLDLILRKAPGRD